MVKLSRWQSGWFIFGILDGLDLASWVICPYITLVGDASLDNTYYWTSFFEFEGWYQKGLLWLWWKANWGKVWEMALSSCDISYISHLQFVLICLTSFMLECIYNYYVKMDVSFIHQHEVKGFHNNLVRNFLSWYLNTAIWCQSKSLQNSRIDHNWDSCPTCK